MARVAKLIIARHEAQVSKAASQIDRQERGVNIARLAGYRSEDLIVEPAIARANHRGLVSPKQFRGISQPKPWRKVVLVGLKDPGASTDELSQPWRQTERRIAKGALDTIVHLFRRSVVFVAQTK